MAKVNYASMSLLGLAGFVVRRSSRQAVAEVLSRMYMFSGGRTTVVDYLDRLGRQPIAREYAGKNDVNLGTAYDLTLDKFLSFPGRRRTIGSGRRGRGADHSGPDCRHYYGVLRRSVKAAIARRGVTGAIAREQVAVAHFENLLRRHFYLSCLEKARSAAGADRRYRWRVKGGTIPVWMPAFMSGTKCRRWLESNIENPDPRRPGERDRVQEVVNMRLGVRTLFSLSGCRSDKEPAACPDPAKVWLLLYGFDLGGLADAVAREKADGITPQRPSIASMERVKLHALILDVFRAIADGRPAFSELAKKYGLSPATFARVFGLKWRVSKNGNGLILPDLWLNLARTISQHPTFLHAARDQGLLDAILWILANDRRVGGAGRGLTCDGGNPVGTDGDTGPAENHGHDDDNGAGSSAIVR